MSKGAFRVAARFETILIDAKDRLRICGMQETSTAYILKKNLVHIEKFDSYQDMHSYFQNTTDMPDFNKATTLFECTETVLEQFGLKHSCPLLDGYLNVSAVTGSRSWERTQKEVCTCTFPIFPLFLIVAKNVHVKDMIKKGMYVHEPMPLNYYIVHPDEREHMERFLAGTDDALYDYVHHLKYDPLHGTEVQAAKQEYEALAKRQKTSE